MSVPGDKALPVYIVVISEIITTQLYWLHWPMRSLTGDERVTGVCQDVTRSSNQQPTTSHETHHTSHREHQEILFNFSNVKLDVSDQCPGKPDAPTFISNPNIKPSILVFSI